MSHGDQDQLTKTDRLLICTPFFNLEIADGTAVIS